MSELALERLNCTAAVQTQVLTTGDAALWRSFLPAERNAFGSVEFASIMERHIGCRGRLFVFVRGREMMAWPLLLQPISALPFATHEETERWDATTPWYTGPLVLYGGRVSLETAHDFQKCFSAYSRAERIVSQFAYLHPWEWCSDLLAPDCVFLHDEIVYVDLSWTEDQIWQDSLTRICRQNINRARRARVHVFEAESMGDIYAFQRVYLSTVRRNQLSSAYEFSPEYFIDIFETLPQHARFTLAEYEDRIVAGLLCLYDDVVMYAYRSGMDLDFQNVRPMNALFYDAILWAQAHNKQRFALGSGPSRPNDGILRFKAEFSPLRAKRFLYRRVCSETDYGALCRAWSAYYQRSASAEKYFPVYRLTPHRPNESAPPEQQET